MALNKTNLAHELIEEAEKLSAAARPIFVDPISGRLQTVMAVAEQFARSWSGSSMGYHSLVYYANFTRPPAGAVFSVEWGLMDTSYVEGSEGDWRPYAYDDVLSAVYDRAEVSAASLGKEALAVAKSQFEKSQPEIKSIVSMALRGQHDEILEGIQQQIQKLTLPIRQSMINAQLHPASMSRDSRAMTGGVRAAPHQSVIADVAVVQGTATACETLAEYARNAANHISRNEPNSVRRANTGGRNIFVGHGGSNEWLKLRIFLQDRLNQSVDEFNRVPTAGVQTFDRLMQMLDDAAFALLVFTAEDENKDGSFQPRMNVIHELGLFQGRLGPKRAIILLEEGCSEFSNIGGLGQIRFPPNRISACFEDVRLILEREQIL